MLEGVRDWRDSPRNKLPTQYLATFFAQINMQITLNRKRSGPQTQVHNRNEVCTTDNSRQPKRAGKKASLTSPMPTFACLE